MARCVGSVFCVVFAVSWASWLLFTCVPARCVVWRGCVACAVPCDTGLLFTSVPARCVVSHVRCPGPLGSCSPGCVPAALRRVCDVLGHLVPVHRCARSVRCVARVRCPGPLGSCSPVCPLAALRCLSAVSLDHLASVLRCARSVCCVVFAVSWATWLLFTGVLPRWAVLRARCPGPLGSCSPVCSLGALCCVCSVLHHLAPGHRCARSVRFVACAVSWASWLLFTGVHTWCFVFCVRCHAPLGPCAPVCSLGMLCCARGVLSHLALVHRCARWVCCAVCCVCGVACAGLRRRWVPSGRAHVHPDGGCFVAGRSWVPSGRAHVHPDDGCFVTGRGWVPSGRALVHPDGGCSGAGRG